MNIKELINILNSNQEKYIKFYLNDQEIPQHFHLTEIGRQNREFIDCGGTRRKTEHCVLQLWVANDLEHRLNSTKMLKIVNMGLDLFLHEIPEVYVEYEDISTSQHPIVSCSTKEDEICFYLGQIHTACLAPEKCGVSCCQPTTITQIQKCKPK